MRDLHTIAAQNALGLVRSGRPDPRGQTRRERAQFKRDAFAALAARHAFNGERP